MLKKGRIGWVMNHNNNNNNNDLILCSVVAEITEKGNKILDKKQEFVSLEVLLECVLS